MNVCACANIKVFYMHCEWLYIFLLTKWWLLNIYASLFLFSLSLTLSVPVFFSLPLSRHSFCQKIIFDQIFKVGFNACFVPLFHEFSKMKRLFQVKFDKQLERFFLIDAEYWAGFNGRKCEMEIIFFAIQRWLIVQCEKSNLYWPKVDNLY